MNEPQMDMSDPAVQAELEADKRAALARLAINPGTFLWNYGPGDTVVYEAFGGQRREVQVSERHADIKGGEPGFSGCQISNAAQNSVWGYDRQIIEVQPFRPNSRNTCPYPGCDEPRAEEWPMTCPEHSPERPESPWPTDPPVSLRCELCDESLGIDRFDVPLPGYTGAPPLEMWDPDGSGSIFDWNLDTPSFLVHQTCGEARGWSS